MWADENGGQNSGTNGDLHANFKLSNGGEAIGLFGPDGMLYATATAYGGAPSAVGSVFAFDTTGPIRTAYTHDKRDLRGRLLFVDSSPEQPFAGVTVLNDPRSDAAAISKALTGNLLIRTRADADTEEARANDTRRGAVALAAGAHFISTDFPEPTPAFGYRFEVPGGTPARCNPLTAPPACTARALEDPQFVGSSAAP